ncbi:MAG: hypothetical protein LBT40_00570 [Deltaproteobacteria bacterium]|jgi:hypothetical protein|nr:hypothetical protein [Deltaproteobacteria bacterium]
MRQTIPCLAAALALAALAFSTAPARAGIALSEAGQPAAAPAAGQGPNIGDGRSTVTEAAQALERIALATRLADDARTAMSPIGLAAAADIFREVAVPAQARQKATECADGTASAEPAAEPAAATDPAASSYAPERLYAEAAELARTQSNEPLAAIIEAQAKAERTRQSARGGTEHHDRVRGNYTDVYTITFRGHERALAMAVADGYQDIDLVVKDENGNTVASDRDSTHVGLCEWTPSWTGDFKLRVINTTAQGVDYTLYTN